jgi:hypothetical protein
VEAWRRRNVLRRDLRAAVRKLSAIAEQRAARAWPEPRRNTFRPLSESEAETTVGAELLAAVAASARRS